MDHQQGSSRLADVWEETEFPTQSLEEGSPLGEVGMLHLQSHRDVSLHVDGGVGVDKHCLRCRDSGAVGGVSHVDQVWRTDGRRVDSGVGGQPPEKGGEERKQKAGI